MGGAVRQRMSREKFQHILFKTLDLSGLAILLTSAFFLSFYAGERGFFAFDQAMYFDGAYRISCGQIPFKDFFMIVGPMTFWLHAIPFKIFGVNYFAYLFGAAFINLLAVTITVAILRLFFPKRIPLSYLGGILTAIWFYPPVGTPCYEQTAMIFSLFAILLITATLIPRNTESTKGNSLIFLAGIMMTAAFLSKQSIIFLFPVFILLIWAAEPNHKRYSWQRTIAFLSGLICSMAAFIWWLWKYSELKTFFYFFFNLPSQFGAVRINKCLKSYLTLQGVGTADFQKVMHITIAISMAAIFLYYICERNMKDTWRRPYLASILCLYGIFFQYVFICCTNNQTEVSSSLVGIIFALGAGVLCEITEVPENILKPISSKKLPVTRIVIKGVVLLAILTSAFELAKRGIDVTFSRSVQEFKENTKFPKYMSIKKLENLKWGQPTKIKSETIKEDDFIGVYEYLKTKGQNFFVFTDFTILYGLLNKPSPQPFLWFLKGETYPAKHNPIIDQKIVDALKKNNVQIVIFEGKIFAGTQIKDFPQTKKYITENFFETKRFGIFSIYEQIANNESLGN